MSPINPALSSSNFRETYRTATPAEAQFNSVQNEKEDGSLEDLSTPKVPRKMEKRNVEVRNSIVALADVLCPEVLATSQLDNVFKALHEIHRDVSVLEWEDIFDGRTPLSAERGTALRITLIGEAFNRSFTMFPPPTDHPVVLRLQQVKWELFARAELERAPGADSVGGATSTQEVNNEDATKGGASDGSSAPSKDSNGRMEKSALSAETTVNGMSAPQSGDDSGTAQGESNVTHEEVKEEVLDTLREPADKLSLPARPTLEVLSNQEEEKSLVEGEDRTEGVVDVDTTASLNITDGETHGSDRSTTDGGTNIRGGAKTSDPTRGPRLKIAESSKESEGRKRGAHSKKKRVIQDNNQAHDNVMSAIDKYGHDEDFTPSTIDRPGTPLDELWLPTDAPAGSAEKIEILRRRVQLGQHLWHPDDRVDYSGLGALSRLRVG